MEEYLQLRRGGSTGVDYETSRRKRYEWGGVVTEVLSHGAHVDVMQSVGSSSPGNAKMEDRQKWAVKIDREREQDDMFGGYCEALGCAQVLRYKVGQPHGSGEEREVALAAYEESACGCRALPCGICSGRRELALKIGKTEPVRHTVARKLQSRPPPQPVATSLLLYRPCFCCLQDSLLIDVSSSANPSERNFLPMALNRGDKPVAYFRQQRQGCFQCLACFACCSPSLLNVEHFTGDEYLVEGPSPCALQCIRPIQRAPIRYTSEHLGSISSTSEASCTLCSPASETFLLDFSPNASPEERVLLLATLFQVHLLHHETE
ncbi:hypothetical protein DIPPA_02423 [Diplonema papillatum]|nr:hypothetical protein DIPPA_02423 [Diplonema papillatum]